jgi:hypothetical protein
MQHFHCKWEEKKGLTMYCIYYSENTFVSSIDFRTWEIDQDKFNIHYKVLIKQNVFLDQFSLSTAMLYYIDDK